MISFQFLETHIFEPELCLYLFDYISVLPEMGREVRRADITGNIWLKFAMGFIRL